jgi:hypothetical protein
MYHMKWKLKADAYFIFLQVSLIKRPLEVDLDLQCNGTDSSSLRNVGGHWPGPEATRYITTNCRASSQQVPVGYGYCNCAPFNPSGNIAPDMLESTTRNIHEFRSSLFCSIGNIVKPEITREVP